MAGKEADKIEAEAAARGCEAKKSCQELDLISAFIGSEVCEVLKGCPRIYVLCYKNFQNRKQQGKYCTFSFLIIGDLFSFVIRNTTVTQP